MQPTRIRLTLCKGALAQLFPHLGTSPQAVSLTSAYAADLRRMLTAHYGIPHVEVHLRPEQIGRMLLVLEGQGVDGDAERERIWDMALTVSRFAYA
ncbi:MAG TPA: hypothetical protein VLQ93_17400 [Myxococcaceae bacterium]|nr:hypothetical protein [Myxococcaceae bacterium]